MNFIPSFLSLFFNINENWYSLKENKESKKKYSTGYADDDKIFEMPLFLTLSEPVLRKDLELMSKHLFYEKACKGFTILS